MAADNTVCVALLRSRAMLSFCSRVVKSLFQIFDDAEMLDLVLPIVDGLLADPDRHKQRAAAEIMGGA
jgi:hypothetical protein